MGKLDPTDGTYHRVSIICEDKHVESTLKYDCGVYFVFSCKTSILKIKTKIHFRYKSLITSELQVLGKINENWELINKVTHNSLTNSDTCVVFSYDLLGYDYEEFQVCLPVQGRVDDYLWIETDTEPVFKVLPLSVVLLGSSVAQDSNCISHGNICCCAYRKYNVNIATVGISWKSSLTCLELLEKLKMMPVKIVVMDLHHVDDISFNNFVKMFPKAYYPVIENYFRQDVLDLCDKYNKIIEPVHINGDGRYDQVHLNSYGSQIYIEELQKRNIIETERS